MRVRESGVKTHHDSFSVPSASLSSAKRGTNSQSEQDLDVSQICFDHLLVLSIAPHRPCFTALVTKFVVAALQACLPRSSGRIAVR